jgi:hypothetical protein
LPESGPLFEAWKFTGVALQNKRVIYDLLFRACAETLLEVAPRIAWRATGVQQSVEAAMSQHTFLRVAGVVFGLIALGHMLRITLGDAFDSVEITLRQPFHKEYEWMAGYTRSRALSNAVVDRNIDAPTRIFNNFGRMPWLPLSIAAVREGRSSARTDTFAEADHTAYFSTYNGRPSRGSRGRRYRDSKLDGPRPAGHH